MDLFSGVSEGWLSGHQGQSEAVPNLWSIQGDGRGLAIDAKATGLWMSRELPAPDERAVKRAVRGDATARRIEAKGLGPKVGDWVGVRLNLNIIRSTGACVHTLHRGKKTAALAAGRGFWDGEVLGYAPAVTLKGAWFSVKQSGREAIASGRQAKHPMASIDGELGSGGCFHGVEARFNPKNQHLFVDSEKQAVRWAEEVTVVGPRAFIRGVIVYHDEHTAPKREENCSASDARLRGK